MHATSAEHSRCPEFIDHRLPSSKLQLLLCKSQHTCFCMNVMSLQELPVQRRLITSWCHWNSWSDVNMCSSAVKSCCSAWWLLLSDALERWYITWERQPKVPHQFICRSSWPDPLVYWSAPHVFEFDTMRWTHSQSDLVQMNVMLQNCSALNSRCCLCWNSKHLQQKPKRLWSIPPVGFHMGWQSKGRDTENTQFGQLTNMIICHQCQCQTMSGIIARSKRKGEREKLTAILITSRGI